MIALDGTDAALQRALCIALASVCAGMLLRPALLNLGLSFLVITLLFAAIFKVLPDPNNTDLGDGYNTAGFRFNNPSGSSNNQITIKADHNLTSGHRIFVRYSWFKTYAIDALNSADATYPGMPQGAPVALGVGQCQLFSSHADVRTEI